MVKHIHFSTKLGLLKHPVITVVREKKDRTKLWTNLCNSKQTTKTNRTGRQTKAIKVKINTFYAHRNTPCYDQDNKS